MTWLVVSSWVRCVPSTFRSEKPECKESCCIVCESVTHRSFCAVLWLKNLSLSLPFDYNFCLVVSPYWNFHEESVFKVETKITQQTFKDKDVCFEVSFEIIWSPIQKLHILWFCRAFSLCVKSVASPITSFCFNSRVQ